MSEKSNSRNTNPVSLAVAASLLIVTSAVIGFVALSVLTGNDFGVGNSGLLERPTPSPRTPVVVQASVVGTPNPSDAITFRSTALGFALEYPRTWRKKERALEVIFSPSTAGLDPTDLQDAAIWFGIPADSAAAPADLLTRTLAEISPNSQRLRQKTIVIGAQPWNSTEFRFEDERLGGPAMATVATTSKNEVGYFVVAVAPAEQWEILQPVFQSIVTSFRFTTEAVLRPTDATPPPTPTPTPTPVFYVVQSGDTLLQIALQYGVDVEALAARNGIDDPRSLQVGTKLIIPIKRR